MTSQGKCAIHFSTGSGTQPTVDEIKRNDFRDVENNFVTLSRSSDYDLMVLNIPMEYASMELIDGQHRLYGFVETDLDQTGLCTGSPRHPRIKSKAETRGIRSDK